MKFAYAVLALAGTTFALATGLSIGRTTTTTEASTPWQSMELGDGTVDPEHPGWTKFAAVDAATNTTVIYMSSGSGIQIGCTGSKLDGNDLQASLDAMCTGTQTCETVDSWKGCDVKSGNTHVYECAYTNYAQPCEKSELAVAVKAIFDVCGDHMSGWWFSGAWNKNYGIDAVAGVGWCCNLATQGDNDGCMLNGPWGGQAQPAP